MDIDAAAIRQSATEGLRTGSPFQREILALCDALDEAVGALDDLRTAVSKIDWEIVEGILETAADDRREPSRYRDEYIQQADLVRALASLEKDDS